VTLTLRRAHLAFGCALLFGALGCNPAPPPSPPPSTQAPEGSPATSADGLAQASPDDASEAAADVTADPSSGATHDTAAAPSPPAAGVIAMGGHITITLDDLQAAVRRAQLFGQPLRAHALADPMQQRLLIDQLLRRALLFEEATARGLPPITDAARRDYLRMVPSLAPFADLDPDALAARLHEAQCSTDDLWGITDEAITAQQLTQALLLQVTDDDLWERYRALNTRARVEALRLLNVPSPQELTRFVREHADEVTQHFTAHPNLYRNPALAHVWTLTRAIPSDATALDIEALRQEVEALRQRARAEDLSTLARMYSDDPLSGPLGGRLAPASESQNPDAFALPIGQPSEVLRRRNHLYFFIVESITPAQERPLDLGLQREIASALLRKRGPSPAAAAAALDLLSAWRRAPQDPFPPPPGSPLAALIAKHHADILPPADIPLDPETAYFPSLGYRAALHAATISLTLDQPFLSEPILDGDSFFIARITARQDASRTRFNAELPLFRAQTMAHIAPSILHQHLAARSAALASTIYVNLRPVQALYGTLQRDGSISHPKPD
jgi:hypothetical protein